MKQIRIKIAIIITNRHISQAFPKDKTGKYGKTNLSGKTVNQWKKGKINWDIFIHEKRMQSDKDASFFYIHHFDFKE